MSIKLNEHRKQFRTALVGSFVAAPVVLSGFAGFFPDKAYDAELLSIEVQRNKRKIAVDVERCTGPNLNKKTRMTEKLYRPPYFHEGFDFCKCDGYRDTFGAGEANFNRGRIPVLANSSRSELDTIDNMVKRAIELQRAQILQYGYVQLKNGDSINYNRLAESMETATVPWATLATADPLGDLQKGGQFIRTKGLSSSMEFNAIMGPTAFSNFRNNPKVIADSDIRRINRGELNMPQFNEVSGMVFQGQYAAGDFIVNIWTYSEVYEDPATGNEIPYLDPENVVMLPKDFVGETSYATTPLIAGEGTGRYIRMAVGKYTIYDVIDQIKAAWQIIYQSSPLAIPITVDRIYTLNTGV